MPAKTFPESPNFINSSEKKVFDALIESLGENHEIFTNYKFFDGQITREVDLIVLSPGHGVTFIEVKGGPITLSPTGQWQNSHGDINPHKQVTDALYRIRDLIHARWSRPYKPVLSWMVAFPDSTILRDVQTQLIPRDRILDSIDLTLIRDKIHRVMHDTQQATNSREDLISISEILKDIATEHQIYQKQWETINDYREKLTQDQTHVLELAEDLDQFIVTGPAGSGKTFLALEQARQHTKAGRDTALICYNVGLAHFLRMQVSHWPLAEQPKFVGTFHALLEEKWQVDHPKTDAAEYWNNTCVEKAMANFSNRNLPRFDAFVVDEAQDFQYKWWMLLTLAYKDANAPSYLNAFGDIDQNIFPTHSTHKFDFPRLKLKQNLRSTTEIVECASVLLGSEIRHSNIVGAKVQFVQSTSEAAHATADDVVEYLLSNPFDAEKMMLLTTNHRHEEQKNRIKFRDRFGYWQSYHDSEEVFYSHVSTFKGLERSAVIVAIDGWIDERTARESLYVAITRACDALVIVGDIVDIRSRFGDQFADYLLEREWKYTFEN